MSRLLDVRNARLDPPKGLSKAATTVFRAIVAATDPAHFTKSDLPLLTQYAGACAMAAEAQQHLDADGAVVGGRASPWLIVQEKSVRAMTALSLRLRLSPQSRLDRKTATLSRGRSGSRGIDALTGIDHADD